jgi:beta-glucosidase
LAGTDVECVWENYPYKTLPEGVKRGLIKEEDIDKSLMRVLTGRFDLGELDNDAIVPWTKIPASILNNEAHRKLALDMARETMTLLQIKTTFCHYPNQQKKIAVIGPNAEEKPMLWETITNTSPHHFNT